MESNSEPKERPLNTIDEEMIIPREHITTDHHGAAPISSTEEAQGHTSNQEENHQFAP